MRVINKEEFEQNKRSIIKELKNSVFIYPTDSIYGLGCDATNKELVRRVRELKNSTLQPFSIIAPSKEWVFENCEVSDEAKAWVDQLGDLAEIDGEHKAFSLILKMKNKGAVASNVLQGIDSVSVRMPRHWFTDIISSMEVPIVTTSANPTGGDFMTCLDDLHSKMRESVPLCVYEGEKKGSPSTLVFCNDGPVCFKKR